MRISALFAKLGHYKRELEWLPILIARIASGLFFVLSGFFKLIDSSQHSTLLKTLKASALPASEFFSYFIPLIEVIFGLMILVGFMTSFAALIMFATMILAISIDHLSSIKGHGGLFFIENFLYLPEVLYAILFLWLFFSGPGKISLDYHLGKSGFSI